MSQTITVVPLTSNIKKVYPFEVLLEIKDSGLSKHSKAQCHRIRTISKIRVEGRKVGWVNDHPLSNINSAIKLHLDI